MYKITLADGTVLDNISANGTTFVSLEDISDSVFENNLSPVDIEFVGDGEHGDIGRMIGHHENMEYGRIESAPGEPFMFALVDVPESEMRYAKMRSDIEYMAMMSDIEL